MGFNYRLNSPAESRRLARDRQLRKQARRKAKRHGALAISVNPLAQIMGLAWNGEANDDGFQLAHGTYRRKQAILEKFALLWETMCRWQPLPDPEADFDPPGPARFLRRPVRTAGLVEGYSKPGALGRERYRLKVAREECLPARGIWNFIFGEEAARRLGPRPLPRNLRRRQYLVRAREGLLEFFSTRYLPLFKVRPPAAQVVPFRNLGPLTPFDVPRSRPVYDPWEHGPIPYDFDAPPEAILRFEESLNH